MLALIAAVIFCTPAPPPTARDRPISNVTRYADVTVRWQDGVVSIVSVKPGRFAKPATLKRFRGRFTAIVAHDKQSLVEVDFDFPLLTSDPEDATDEARKLGARLRKGLTATTTVRVPLPDEADTLVVYDNQTRKEVKAPLPAAPPPRAPRER